MFLYIHTNNSRDQRHYFFELSIHVYVRHSCDLNIMNALRELQRLSVWTQGSTDKIFVIKSQGQCGWMAFHFGEHNFRNTLSEVLENCLKHPLVLKVDKLITFWGSWVKISVARWRLMLVNITIMSLHRHTCLLKPYY